MLIVALALLAAQAAASPPSVPRSPHGQGEEIACPVGGERFQAWRTTTFSTYGERPDGKPYSYLPFPLPVPECPTNRLVVFDTFSDAEVQALTKLIASPDYVGPIGAETRYYRAYWLATRLGRPVPRAMEMLLAAIWEVSPGFLSARPTPQSATRLVRYQADFLERAGALPIGIDPKERLWIEARAANAARQLGRFADAETMRRQALVTLSRVPEPRGWDAYLTKLGVVIARRDRDVEPLDMIPDRQIAFACAARTVQNDFDRTICSRPDVAARVAEVKDRAASDGHGRGGALRP